MKTGHIMELIDRTIEEVIFEQWKHEGYLDISTSDKVAFVVDGKRFVIEIKEEG